jgi:hypothetical protein
MMINNTHMKPTAAAPADLIVWQEEERIAIQALTKEGHSWLSTMSCDMACPLLLTDTEAEEAFADIDDRGLSTLTL